MAYVDVEKAIKILSQDGIVALPTETVYGLAGSIMSKTAIENIFLTKKRPSFDPLIVHVHSIEQAINYALDWPEIATEICKKFWPGPLTIVVKKNEKVSSVITAGQDTVALRMPNHDLFLTVLKKLNFPLAAPSANFFGKTSPTSAEHVISEFAGKIPVLDGGACKVGIESTIISISEDSIQLLRHGMITKSELKNFTGIDVIDCTKKSKTAGSLENHYQPKTELILIESNLSFNDLKDSYQNHKKATELVIGDNPELAARNLYGKLREIDKHQYDYIYFPLREFHKQENWSAILDRVKKASHFTFCSENGENILKSKNPNA